MDTSAILQLLLTVLVPSVVGYLIKRLITQQDLKIKELENNQTTILNTLSAHSKEISLNHQKDNSDYDKLKLEMETFKVAIRTEVKGVEDIFKTHLDNINRTLERILNKLDIQ